MIISRVVFENGISARLNQGSGHDEWILKSSEDQQSVASPEEVTQTYGVRPVAAFQTHELVGERASLFRTDGQLVWECYYEFFHQTHFWQDLSLFQRKRNLDYILDALMYHCVRVAQMYGRICSDFVQMTTPEVRSSGLMDYVTIGSPVDPVVLYFEVDALITAARRCYETTRHILWPQFGPSTDTPRTFPTTLERCDRLPDALRERLSASWSQFGERLKDYRDCIQHYAPITPQMPCAKMTRLAGGVWSACFWLPDNPQAKSVRKFTFGRKIDALTYGWELANEILEICRAIIDEVQNSTSA